MWLHTNKILILLLLCQASSSVKNSLTFFAIISTGIKNLPNLFTTVVDDIQVDYYDSNGTRKQSTVLLPDIYMLNTLFFKTSHSNFLILSVLAVLQCMSGCELDEKSAEVVTFQKCGYNGEDFMKLDFKNLTWIAQHTLAENFTLELNLDQQRLNNTKVFLSLTCPKVLNEFVIRSALQREDLTSVVLLQKTPSSLVNCFATGFYPNTARMFWMRDGMEIQNDKEPSEILPNHDNTYQMSVYLNVSSIASEDWKRYDCVFRLGNKTKLTRLKKEITEDGKLSSQIAQIKYLFFNLVIKRMSNPMKNSSYL
uniref:Ig-like domain-containing protein n=1 Tax=Xiphophorus couchianus TaxID=32473 RepID=A0A3B5MKJ6_9TELE